MIPEKYTNPATSGLTFEVKPTSNTFDIDLPEVSDEEDAAEVSKSHDQDEAKVKEIGNPFADCAWAAIHRTAPLSAQARPAPRYVLLAPSRLKLRIVSGENPCSAHLSELLGFKGLGANRFFTFRRANWHRYLNRHKRLRREIRTRCAESPRESIVSETLFECFSWTGLA